MLIVAHVDGQWRGPRRRRQDVVVDDEMLVRGRVGFRVMRRWRRSGSPIVSTSCLRWSSWLFLPRLVRGIDMAATRKSGDSNPDAVPPQSQEDEDGYTF